MYQFAVQSGFNEGHTRALVFATLIAANIFLTLVNRSFYYSVLTTIRYKNPLVAVIIGLTVVLAGALLYEPVLAHFFGFERLSGQELLLSVATGCVSVVWFEAVKAVKRHRKPGIAAPRQ
jgi:Ca2+-transporting ATPase